MKKSFIILSLLLGAHSASASDNMADCEAVLLQKVMLEGEPTGAVMQTYAPAANVLASIYDEEDGFQDEIDNQKVKAILCERTSVVPTLRDFPILATGIPFALSNNFDATDSRSVTIFFKDGEFQHIFKGTELSEDQQTELDDAMEIFNLQPHELVDKTPKAKKKKKKLASQKSSEEVDEVSEVEAQTESDEMEEIEEEETIEDMAQDEAAVETSKD